MPVEITALYRYPVKSCRGIAVDSVELDRFGIVEDRRWMVVDPAGRFITQRERPRMALITAALSVDALRLSAPGLTPLEIPRDAGEGCLEVQIWRDRCVTVDQGDSAAAWLSDALGFPCRLVRSGPEYVRHVNPAYGREGDQVAFADGYPLLLISEESLADLNGRLSAPVPMERFRPNLVVRGAAEAFAEDTWRGFRVLRTGETYRVVKPCDRCQVPTIDQRTGERTGVEPLATLNRYRRFENKVLFGQNVIHDWPGAPMSLQMGDNLDARE